jgi:hypothetical protein
MTKRNAKKPTVPTAEELAGELYDLSTDMILVAYRIRRYGLGRGTLQQAECDFHARELDGAAKMAFLWANEVKKEGKK